MSDEQLPLCPQARPYVVEEEPGNYAWCSCGKSMTQPYCDGSHGGTGFKPIVVKLDDKKVVAWCGCKKSSNMPYCDGTHSKL